MRGHGWLGARSRRVLCTPVVCGLMLLAPATARADIGIGDAFVDEANGAATATFTIARQAALLAPARTVEFVTADGSARAPGDYGATSGSVSFPAAPLGGTQTQRVSVTVNGDTLDEPTETFRVLIRAAEAIGDGEGIGTVVDDDPAPQVAVADAPRVRESAARASFEVRMTAPSGRDVSVSYVTADGSAKAGRDYAPSAGRLTIPAGQRVATVDVALKNDAVREPTESFELRLSAPSDATVGDGSATGRITDDDTRTAGSPAAGARAGTLARGTRLGLSRLRLRRPKTVLIDVSCPAPARRCRGRLTLFTLPRRASKIPALRSERMLGRRTFGVAGGRIRTLRLGLRPLGPKLLRRAGSLRVRAYAVVEDATGRAGFRQVSGRLVLRRGRR